MGDFDRHGRAVFAGGEGARPPPAHVDGALPGELVELLRTEREGPIDGARTLEVIEASAQRVEARCRHYGVCGGCSLMHLDVDAQIAFKQRVLLEDFELDGHVLPDRALAALLIGAGNRDPKVFEDPDRLDLSRTPNPHVSFSTGIHHCLGAALARLEAELAIPALLRELPGLELDGRPRWRETFVLRGFTRLPLRWRV